MQELSYNAELDAINEMLSVLGELPVNTLDGVTDMDVLNALRILRTVNRREQSRDWSFNKVEITLNPDEETQKINWSDSYLYLRGTDGAVLKKREKVVYDFTNKTDRFTKAITVDAVLLLEFDEMPETFRGFVIARAASDFQKRYLADSELYQILEQDVAEAWARLQEYELDLTEANLLNSPSVQTIRRRS